MNQLSEHSVVEAISNIHEGDTVILAGSIGTIVHLHPKGYEVEFQGNDTSEVVYCSEDSIKLKE
jgi:preprotein translocase subunit YajC